MKTTKQLIPLFALVFLLFFNISCLPIRYYSDLAKHQAILIRSQVPVDDILNNINTDEKTKHYLQISKQVLKLNEDLGIPAGENYQNFVMLKQDSVTYVLSAAHKYKLKKYIWSYPIVGKLPYKGFPKKEDAIKEAKKMKELGYDVYVRGVSAYSTLGWFKDPIFSSMLKLDEIDFVSTLIHESLHYNIFVKNKADYNEQLATFVGMEGAKLFYTDQPKKLQQINHQWHDMILFSQFIYKELEELKKWYLIQKDISEEKKQKRLKLIQTHFIKEIKHQLKSDQYVHFPEISLNNARLLLFGTYMKDIATIRKDWINSGMSLKDWIASKK